MQTKHVGAFAAQNKTKQHWCCTRCLRISIQSVDQYFHSEPSVFVVDQLAPWIILIILKANRGTQLIHRQPELSARILWGEGVTKHCLRKSEELSSRRCVISNVVCPPTRYILCHRLLLENQSTRPRNSKASGTSRNNGEQHSREMSRRPQ